MQSPQLSAALQDRLAITWCWVAAHLYEKQMSTCAIAVTHASSEPCFAGLYRATENASCPQKCCSAVLLVAAHLYDEQTSIDVIAVIRACCDPVLQSSTEQWRMYFALESAAMQLCWVAAHLYDVIPMHLACGGAHANTRSLDHIMQGHRLSVQTSPLLARAYSVAS